MKMEEHYDSDILSETAGLEKDVTEGQVVQSSDGGDVFNRPVFLLLEDESNRLRLISESTFHHVPKSFQLDWEDLLYDRRMNIGLLDGFQFVVDRLMREEGFRVLQVKYRTYQDNDTIINYSTRVQYS